MTSLSDVHKSMQAWRTSRSVLRDMHDDATHGSVMQLSCGMQVTRKLELNLIEPSRAVAAGHTQAAAGCCC